LWRYWLLEECDGKAEKAFTKWLPGMFPTHLKSLEEVYSCTSWRTCGLNNCRVLYFSEIKLFREHFEATTHINQQMNSVNYSLW
jgi:hypothetical protein